MAKIFISHSTRNKELVRNFVDFLQVGMGIAREEIFYTSQPGILPTGEDFINNIKRAMLDCEAVIFIITEEYMRSAFCMAELGAAWGLSKKVYPLLLIDIAKIENTPIKGLQVLMLNKENDVSALYDEFCTRGIIQKPCTAEFLKRLPDFIQQVNVEMKGDALLQPDGEGYYHSEVVSIRNVPAEFKCYKIKGHLEDWSAENAAKTDWIFFRTGMYKELEVGDRIRFKVTKTDVNWWKDIGWARNIYPADLIKLK